MVIIIIIQDIGFNRLYIRYRDKDNKLIEERVKFKPYFWSFVKTNEESLINYDGKRVYKRYFENSGDRKTIKQSEVTYELDVSPENRWLIDNFDTLPEYKPRIMHLDIETKMCLDTLTTPEPITAITMYDQYTDEYITLSWKPIYEGHWHYSASENWKVYVYRTEEDMLDDFKEFFLMYDPDIITGWNVLYFDIFYIINRLYLLGKEPEALSPVNRLAFELNEHTKNPIEGRIVFDLKMGYEKLHDGDIGFTNLRSVLEDNDAPIRKLDGLDDWEIDFDGFLKYNQRDVEGTVWIDSQFDIIQSFLERQYLVGGKFTDTYYNKDVIDVAMLRHARKKGIALPTAKKVIDDTSYAGATIYKPITGVHLFVVVFDVKSMYPSSMEAGNMSHETIIKTTDHEIPAAHLVKLGNGVTFRRDFEGFTIDLLHEIQDYRELNKLKMKQFKIDSPDYRKYDNKQRVAKFLKNSLYGVFGYKSFRLYDLDIAKSITWLSRQSIAHIRETVETNYPDTKTLYGHTDSIFVKVPEISMAKGIEDTINSSWGSFEDKYNLIRGKYEIETDKIFSALLIAGPNMYAGRLESGKLVIKGFAVKKRSATPIVKDLQANVINMLLDQKDHEEIFTFIRSIVEKIRSGNCTLDEITVKMKLKRPLTTYANNSVHVYAAKWANENLGCNLKNVGDVVQMVYVKKDEYAKIKKVNTNGVIAFENVDQIKDFTIDLEETINHLIPGKIRLICKAMGWSIEELLRENTTIGAKYW